MRFSRIFTTILAQLMVMSVSFIGHGAEANAGEALTGGSIPLFPTAPLTASYLIKEHGKFRPHCKVTTEGDGTITVVSKTTHFWIEHFGQQLPGHPLRGNEIGFQIYQPLFVYWNRSGMNILDRARNEPDTCGEREILGHQCIGYSEATRDASDGSITSIIRWYDRDTKMLVKLQRREGMPLWAQLLGQQGLNSEIILGELSTKAMTQEEIEKYQQIQGQFFWESPKTHD